MFAPCSGWARGSLWLCGLRVWICEAVERQTCRASQVRPYGSGGCDRRPGSESEVTASDPAARTLKEWALQVSPFGRLRARLPCDLTVRPLDPLNYPDADRVLVAVSSVDGGVQGLEGLQVRYDEEQKEVAIESETMDSQASVEVDAPLKFDLNIKSSGSGCVKVQNIECDNCEIETEQGTSTLQSIKRLEPLIMRGKEYMDFVSLNKKSQKVHVQTKGGKIICLGTVYGNIDIHASQNGTVTVDKLQGSFVNISTEDGFLKAKYLYTESSFLSSATGDITLGSVHGDITLQSKMGNITVDSSSGCLKASTHQGAIDVYVSQLGEVDLKSHKGSVTVKVPSSLQAHLQLSGKEVDVYSELRVQEKAEACKDDGVTVTGFMNEAGKQEKWIKAEAPKGTENEALVLNGYHKPLNIWLELFNINQ